MNMLQLINNNIVSSGVTELSLKMISYCCWAFRSLSSKPQLAFYVYKHNSIILFKKRFQDDILHLGFSLIILLEIK